MTAGFEAGGRPSSERGFTLVELIFVMAIAGILAAVAMPRLVGKNSFDTRGFSDQLAATVRFAQKLAIAQRRQRLCAAVREHCHALPQSQRALFRSRAWAGRREALYDQRTRRRVWTLRG